MQWIAFNDQPTCPQCGIQAYVWHAGPKGRSARTTRLVVRPRRPSLRTALVSERVPGAAAWHLVLVLAFLSAAIWFALKLVVMPNYVQILTSLSVAVTMVGGFIGFEYIDQRQRYAREFWLWVQWKSTNDVVYVCRQCRALIIPSERLYLPHSQYRRP